MESQTRSQTTNIDHRSYIHLLDRKGFNVQLRGCLKSEFTLETPVYEASI